MDCLICTAPSDYYFSKTYTEPPYDSFMVNIGPVHYFKCSNCGFVLSKTHTELQKNEWIRLNHDTHVFFEDTRENKLVNQPPYANQALMLRILGENGIIDTSRMIDYAAGYGTLSNILARYFDMDLAIYDPYVIKGSTDRYLSVEELGKYKVVLNSAMFEHILTRPDLESVNDLVDDDGCLVLHTLICENIPADPNWFYLKPPVHTAFHTNKSMNILMDQWGYRSSIYCPQGKSWVLLKNDSDELADLVAEINEELQLEYLFYKPGFVDYWKGF